MIRYDMQVFNVQSEADKYLHNIRVKTSKWTRCSAIAERPRCRVRHSFRQK